MKGSESRLREESWVALLGKAPLGRVGRYLSSVGGARFGEDVADVMPNGVKANEQLFANQPVGLTRSDQPQDLNLSLGQAIGVGRSSNWLGCGSILKGSHPLHEGAHA